MDNTKYLSLKMSATVALAFFSLTSAVGDERATEELGTVCRTVEREIYSAKSVDIKDFRASKRGLQQVSKQYFPNENVTLYSYEPGTIFCVVKSPDKEKRSD